MSTNWSYYCIWKPTVLFNPGSKELLKYHRFSRYTRLDLGLYDWESIS
jgi:hypothetical protein